MTDNPSEAAMRAAKENMEELEKSWGMDWGDQETWRDDVIQDAANTIEKQLAPELKKEFDRGYEQGAKHASES